MKHQTATISEDRVPKTFSLCIHEQCPMAKICLRRMVWSTVADTEEQFSIISPSYAVPGEGCRYFRSTERVVYARGFRGMQARMLPGQYVDFSQRLISYFSRNSYYERRRGERLCSPKDMAYIREVLAELGLPHLEFDAYEKHYNFTD